MERPAEKEYAGFYSGYINLVPECNIVSLMESQLEETMAMLKNIPEDKVDYSYAPGKWTIKEMLGHIIDTERIFSYRALSVARNDKTPLSVFEQDDYIKYANYNLQNFSDLTEQFYHLRKSVILMFKTFSEETMLRIGTLANHDISTNALAYIIVGHVIHHIKILKERYL